jgi:UDP:flavonoid glycosyltransferase YjiC (YdhE family)
MESTKVRIDDVKPSPGTIFFTCQGTRGDVAPYTNLGVELAARGWRVTVGAPPEFATFVLNSHKGLNFWDIGAAPSYEASMRHECSGLENVHV